MFGAGHTVGLGTCFSWIYIYLFWVGEDDRLYARDERSEFETAPRVNENARIGFFALTTLNSMRTKRNAVTSIRPRTLPVTQQYNFNPPTSANYVVKRAAEDWSRSAQW